eukprot:GHVR01119457.1.p1 GENE.GHVR01119457.1~~GHVR01119457.1.p1  ORF type:complete len:179 (-),score=43.38 GHVR01119457.1:84-620(-)
MLYRATFDLLSDRRKGWILSGEAAGYRAPRRRQNMLKELPEPAPLPPGKSTTTILQVAPHISSNNKCCPPHPAFSFYQYTLNIKRQPYYIPLNKEPYHPPPITHAPSTSLPSHAVSMPTSPERRQLTAMPYKRLATTLQVRNLMARKASVESKEPPCKVCGQVPGSDELDTYAYRNLG